MSIEVQERRSSFGSGNRLRRAVFERVRLTCDVERADDGTTHRVMAGPAVLVLAWFSKASLAVYASVWACFEKMDSKIGIFG